MKDVLVLAMTLGFFGICVTYVGLCDRIVGPDELGTDADGVDTDDGVQTAATSAEEAAR